MINLLFGWTVLGWIAALIWAGVEKTEPIPEKEKPWTEGEPQSRDLSSTERAELLQKQREANRPKNSGFLGGI